MRIHTLLCLLALGCGEDKKCDLVVPTKDCKDGQVCETVGGTPTCTAPLLIRGKVTNQSAAAIANALVSAVDANDAPASGADTTDAMGAYEIRVPVARAADGKPMQMQVKLRGSAAGYETFPSGIRRSLPIELS